MKFGALCLIVSLGLAGARLAAPSIADDIKALEQHEAVQQNEEKTEDFTLLFNRNMNSKAAAKEIAETDAQAHAEMVSHENDNIDSFGAPLRNDIEGNANLAFNKVVLDRSAQDANAVDHTRIEGAQNECMAQCMVGFHGTLRTCVKKCKKVALVEEVPKATIADDIKELEAREAAEQREEKKERVSDGVPLTLDPNAMKNSARKELAAQDAQSIAEFRAESLNKYDSFGAIKRDDMEVTANEEFDKVVMDRSGQAAEAADQSKLEARKKECMAQCIAAFHGSLRTCVKKCKKVH